eukprot:jgi/Psemu1/321816/estExt_fgenesh1_pg.C_110022
MTIAPTIIRKMTLFKRRLYMHIAGRSKKKKKRLFLCCVILTLFTWNLLSMLKFTMFLGSTKGGSTEDKPHVPNLMDFAKREFSGDQRVVFATGLTSDKDLKSFMEGTVIGQTSTKNRIATWVVPFFGGIWGFKGEKFHCIRDANPSARKQRTTLFYFLTSADDYYLYQLQLSICTARESNPELNITVGVHPDYFPDERTLSSAIAFLLNELNLGVFFFDKLEYGYSGKIQRFNKNWLRLRLWELEDYFETILYVDADTAIHRDLSRLLSWDVDFASANDMDKVGLYSFSTFGKIQAGVLLIQPCKQVFLQMRAILENNDITAFTSDHAEQSFLDWYYKFDGVRFGYEYNYIASAASSYLSPRLYSANTVREPNPYIVHFTRDKIVRDSKLQYQMQALLQSCHEKTRGNMPLTPR